MRAGFYRAAGFTLLEMVIAIGILAVIVGGIGTSVSTCLQATEIVHRERLHQTECDALQALLSHSLLVLPTDAVLRCAMVDVRNDQPPPLRLRARQPALVFISTPSQPGMESESSILFRKQANGLLTLGGANAVNDRQGFLPADSLASPTLNWVPLMQGIREAKWRFYDSLQGKWIDRWEKEDTRPTLVELTLQFAESPMPFVGVFWLPSPQVNAGPLSPGSPGSGNPGGSPTPPQTGGTNAPANPAPSAP